MAIDLANKIKKRVVYMSDNEKDKEMRYRSYKIVVQTVIGAIEG